MNRLSGCMILLALGFYARAQNVLSLEDAIAAALKNNYSISILRNESEIAKNNNSLGNAGFLPLVSLNASNSAAINNTKQSYASGLEVNRADARSSNLNAGIGLNWTLFDGLKMFATRDKLKELEAMGALNAKIQIENTVAEIIRTYYDIVRQKQLLRSTQEFISVYEERIKIAEMRSSIGSGSKADILQAKVDMNVQRSAQIKQRTELKNSKAAINQLLNRPADTEFDVNDSIVITYKPGFDELKKTITTQNNTLLFSEKNISVSNSVLRETRSLALPRVTFNMNYMYSRSENQASFVLLNQNTGLNGGFTASWNLFNGFNSQRQYRNAKLSVLNSQLEYAQAKSIVETELLNSYQELQDALETLKLEEESVAFAKENMDLMMARFKLGNATSVELKESQRSLEDVQTQLVNARYNAKLAETELMRLNGSLVK